jgi:hypothetical protein
MTTTSHTPIEFDDSVSQWERLLYAFPAEKERRSGSLRTVQSCSRMLLDCFGRAGKTPDRLSQHDVFARPHAHRCVRVLSAPAAPRYLRAAHGCLPAVRPYSASPPGRSTSQSVAERLKQPTGSRTARR